MKKSIFFLAFVSLLLTFSCSGGGGSSSGGSANTLNGSWSGTYVGWNSNHYGPITATFILSGSSFTGTLAMDSLCSSAGGTISGSISGDNISFSTPNGTFSGNFTDPSISGDYTVTSGACSGDIEIFQLHKS